ncbi:MAG TPA: MFS transporter [Rectinemataceae bacterium]|nr:MFS transporter [Rectinemataceae bacterium]
MTGTGATKLGSPEDSPRSLKRAALAVSCLASFMTPYLSSAVSIALPTIGREFGMSAASLGWVSTAFLVSAAACLLPFGSVADMIGRRRLFLVGVALYTLFCALASIAPGGAALIAAVALIGASAAMIFGTGVAILTSVYPPAERGRVLGINVAFTYAGLSLGPLLGGVLTRSLGWRSVYLLNVPVGLATLAVVLIGLRGEWRGESGRRFDLVGSLISASSLACLVWGLSLLPAVRGFILVAASAACLALFVLQEGRATNPLLSLGLFRGNRVFGMSNLAALINYSATFALTFFMSLYFQVVKGMGPDLAGLILMAQPVVMVIFSPIAGRLSDRHEPQLLASIGMAIMAVMLGLLATLGPRTALLPIVLDLMAVGTGYAFFSSPNTNAVMGSVPPRHYGIASATLGTMRLVGQMLSMGIAMLMLSLSLGRRPVGPALSREVLQGMRLCFAIFTALCVAGVFASLARGKRIRDPGR